MERAGIEKVLDALQGEPPVSVARHLEMIIERLDRILELLSRG